MAITATVMTDFGEQRDLYIRLNNVEGVNNHGYAGESRFRGYLSHEAFLAGKQFVWERLVTFTPDVSEPIWTQGYTALKAALADPADPLDAKLAPGSQIVDA